MSPIPPNDKPLRATAIDGDVVLASGPGGCPVDAAFTPEAVLASLEVLRQAAEEAIGQRRTGRPAVELGGPEDLTYVSLGTAITRCVE